MDFLTKLFGQSRAGKEAVRIAALRTNGYTDLSLAEAKQWLGSALPDNIVEAINLPDDFDLTVRGPGYGLTVLQILSGCMEGTYTEADVVRVGETVLWKHGEPKRDPTSDFC